MVSQQIVFTVMPRAVSRNADPLPVSVFVSPRLVGAERLASFPDWLSWTRQLVDDGLSLTFSAPGGTLTVPIKVGGLRPALWSAMFNEETYVRSHTFDDYSHHSILSYPQRYALSVVKSIYQRAGVELALPDHARHGRREDTSAKRGIVRELVQGLAVNWDEAQAEQLRTFDRANFDSANALFPMRYAAGTIGDDGLLTLSATPSELNRMFRERMSQQFAVANHIPRGKPLADAPPDLAKLIDFHQALSSLNSYPELLRDLGIVFDFALPRDLLELGGAPTGTLGVTGVPGAQWQLADTAVPPVLPTPSTRYLLSKAGDGSTIFATAPEGYGGPDDHLDTLLGLLNLHPNRYGLAQVDVDGAMHKLIMLAETWQGGLLPSRSAHPDVFDEHATVPSLRSGGLSLFADGRARKLLGRLKQSKTLNDALSGNGAAPPLTAEDLVHGYRLDVWDSHTGHWHSLHRRHAEFTISDQSRTVADSEGFTELAATQAGPDPDQPQPPDLYLHESIARWTGWSLSVPPPGKHLSSDPDPEKALDNPTENQPATPFPMTTVFRAAGGSLPSLRFGRRYRLRARVTDICGNSLGADDPLVDEMSTGGLSLPVDPEGYAYLRYEPVAAPLVVARDIRAVTGPGSELHRLVIRTFNANPSLDAVAADLTAGDRHLVPPRATVDLAEKLGMFDDATGKLNGSAAMHTLIAARDSGQIRTETSEVAGHEQTYPLEPAENITALPFLPDVLARGVALRDLPGTAEGTLGQLTAAGDPTAGLDFRRLSDPSPRAGTATLVDFGSNDDWQYLQPLRLSLKDPGVTDRIPAWDGNARELSVFIPKASTQLVPLSSYLLPADLTLMGVWQWVREYIDARTRTYPEPDFLPSGEDTDVDLIAHVLQRTVEGGHWMLTPPTILTLVHATQQPLGRPAFCGLTVQHEAYGNPKAPPGDETRSPSPTVLQTSPEKAPTQATELDPITAWRKPGALDAFLLGGLHIHGASTEKIDLTAEWTDPLDDLAITEPTEVRHSAAVDEIPVRDPHEGIIEVKQDTPSSRRRVAYYDSDHDLLCFVRAGDSLGNLPSSDPHGTQTMDADAAPRHHLNDTLHHAVLYTATATSAFSDYFPSNVEGGFVRSSEPVTVHVPASARPKAPQLAYVVPTFGWQRQTETNIKRSVRFGGGLRIYLERGWFSSGAGELLGISLYSLANGPMVDYDAWKSHVTEWGGDPIWRTDSLWAQTPGISNFPDAHASEQMVALDAHGSPLADVVGYPVTYDAERQLWFADVTINTESLTYAPFIRLALVRYQPHALPEAKVSRVVTADFAQLTPSRAAMISADPYHPRRLRVTISGIAPAGPTPVIVHEQPAEQVHAPTGVTVVVQQRRDDLEGDLAWLDAKNDTASVTDRTAEAVNPPQLLRWTGTVDFAAPVETDKYRLLICEYEYYSANHLLTEVSASTGEQVEVNPRRLIYAETVTVDDSMLGGPAPVTGTSFEP